MHTPTPWEVKSTQTKSNFTNTWREIYAGRTPVVCSSEFTSSIHGVMAGVFIKTEDADFIIKACNHHDDLLMIAKTFLLQIKTHDDVKKHLDQQQIDLINNIVERATD
jgi:hypothetical protein